MTRALRIVGFAAVTIGGTVLAGWWSVPLLAAAWVRALPLSGGRARGTAAGAALGWASLLGWGALHGLVPSFARMMSSAVGLPSWGFIAATLVYPALLAGTAALMARPAGRR